MAPDRLSLCKARDRLIHHGLKDRGGEILPRRSLIDQGLNVCLCEDAAAGRYRIDHPIAPRERIQTRRIGIEKGCHLVDEGAGSARADPVHPLIYAAPEVDDLCVLSAELDGDIGVRPLLFQSGRDGDDLLTEGSVHMLSKREPSGAGDDRGEGNLSELLPGLREEICESFLNICEMSSVVGEEKFPRGVQHRGLYRGGADIDPQSVIFPHR